MIAGINFRNQDRTLGTVAKVQLHHVLFLAGDVGRLRQRLFQLEAIGRFQLRDGKLARIEPLAQLMHTDLALGVRIDFTVVDGGGGFGGLAVAGVAILGTAVEFGPDNPSFCHADAGFRGVKSIIFSAHMPIRRTE